MPTTPEEQRDLSHKQAAAVECVREALLSVAATLDAYQSDERLTPGGSVAW